MLLKNWVRPHTRACSPWPQARTSRWCALSSGALRLWSFFAGLRIGMLMVRSFFRAHKASSRRRHANASAALREHAAQRPLSQGPRYTVFATHKAGASDLSVLPPLRMGLPSILQLHHRSLTYVPHRRPFLPEDRFSAVAACFHERPVSAL